jgi:SAM-dependent methyltransferase
VSDPRTDRARLQEEAYADSGRVQARASIYAFNEDGFELLPWVLGTVTWPCPGPLLDVGCGWGQYLGAAGGGIGLDLSLGMAQEAGRLPGVVTLQADVAALPVAAGSVARVLAPHMLYHVADPARAVAELRRVLRADGEAVVVLNDEGHLAELRGQVEVACGRPLRWEALLTHEAVPLLDACFDEVEHRLHAGRLLVSDPEAVATYVDSLEAIQGTETRPWSQVVDHARVWAAGEIAEHGHVEIETRFSTLVAR